MKKYNLDNSPNLIKKLSLFKKAKEKEKEYTEEKVLQEMFPNEAERNAFSEKLKEFEKKKKENTAEKKVIKETAASIQNEINDIIMKAIPDDELIDKEKYEFKEFGSITFSVEEELEVDLTEEEKQELVEYLIDSGEYELIELNEKAYKEYSRKIYPTLGHHVKGVESHRVIKSTIRS